MLARIFASVNKEMLLLFRDKGGLAMIFLMPLALIVIMSLIQDAPFRDYQEADIPLIMVNDDNGELGETIEKGLHESRVFSITTTIDGARVTEERATQLVKSGEYKLAVIIPKGTSDSLNKHTQSLVQNALANAGLTDTKIPVQNVANPIPIRLLFDPASKQSLKSAVKGSLGKYTSTIETQSILKVLNQQIAEATGQDAPIAIPDKGFIQVEEVSFGSEDQALLLANSVQHNVPAWTIFAMFFIVIPLATNIIKERESGVLARVKTLPGSFSLLLAGKFVVYFIVCFLQLVCMLSVGVFILPLLGLPTLQLGHNFIALFIISVSVAFAAIGYGLMVGTLFNTHPQAAIFGSISVVIMAAVGGIWVPSYVMPEIMQKAGALSPLNWGLEAFNDIFLRSGGVTEIYQESLLLICFFLATGFIAFLYSRFVRSY